MSTEAAVWIEISIESFVTTCIGCAVSALLVYDWLLTFDREVRLIWRQPRTGASLLYFCTRYMIIVENMVDNITIYPVSDVVCTATMWTAEVLACLGLIGPGLFSALRVHALMGESRLLSVLVLVLGLIPFFVNVIPAYKLKAINLSPPLGCQIEVDESFGVHEICTDVFNIRHFVGCDRHSGHMGQVVQIKQAC
ncbi:hypothetical protein C8Q79DRAFT_421615 [Trametes meyenii]|nr:hypothetical protein C8Q79DRAFT_421615 [Trametes meyenii]